MWGNKSSLVPAISDAPPQRRYGGRITATDELSVHANGDTFTLDGSGTISRLPLWPRGTTFTATVTGAPTIAHSTSRIIVPGGQNLTCAAGDRLAFVSQGDGVWRLFVTPAALTTQSQNDNSTNAATTAYVDRLAPRGFIDGLKVSTDAVSATIGITAGQARDSTNTVTMAFASAYTKTTGAWAVGSGNGSFDGTGSSASTTLHVHLITRLDTGVTDILTSRSATAPTLPTNYTKFRHIMSIITNGSSQSTYAQFQDGDDVVLGAPVSEVSAVNPGTSAVTRTLAAVPTGIRVKANLHVSGEGLNDVGPGGIYISDLSVTDSAAAMTSAASVVSYNGSASGDHIAGGMVSVMTNTSAQIRSRIQLSTSAVTLRIHTVGWTHPRGKNL